MTPAELMCAYFTQRRKADEAYARKNGAACTGWALLASLSAQEYARATGLASSDAAVAEMRRLRGAHPTNRG